MGAKLALCLEEEACRNPQIVGLEGESLDTQVWIDVYTSGEEARANVSGEATIEELWVLSCDDVEPINLAASIKADKPSLRVCLVVPQRCGSLLSRAHTAGIDEVVDFSEFLHRYVQAKKEAGENGCRAAKERDETAAAEAMLVCEKPKPPEELISEEAPAPAPNERLLQFRPRLPQRATDVESRTFVLTVVSGSGGAGKSAVSALGALISSRWGYKTLLLDCDLQFGDVASMVGADQALCIDEALLRPDRLEAEIAQTTALYVLAAPTRLEASESIVQELPGFLDQLSKAFEVVVVNTGASWAEQHAALLERSSVALFLVDQRVSSVRACRHALELCARCGIATTPFQYALNRCVKGAPLTTIDVSSALQGAPVYELKDGGRDVEDYLSGGAAEELIELKNEFAKSLERVMEKLLPGGSRVSTEPVNALEEKRPFLRRARHGSAKRGRKSS